MNKKLLWNLSIGESDEKITARTALGQFIVFPTEEGRAIWQLAREGDTKAFHIPSETAPVHRDIFEACREAQAAYLLMIQPILDVNF